MKNFTYVEGNLASPKSIGPQIIAHVCNDSGIWFGQHAADIFREWPHCKRYYLDWYQARRKNDFGLGSVQFVNGNRTHVNRLIRLANMVCISGRQKIRYRAITQCLKAVARKAMQLGATVHLPRISNDFTDSWDDLVVLIQGAICNRGVRVFVYQDEPVHDEKFFSQVLNPPVRPRFDLYQFRSNCGTD